MQGSGYHVSLCDITSVCVEQNPGNLSPTPSTEIVFLISQTNYNGNFGVFINKTETAWKVFISINNDQADISLATLLIHLGKPIPEILPFTYI